MCNSICTSLRSGKADLVQTPGSEGQGLPRKNGNRWREGEKQQAEKPHPQFLLSLDVACVVLFQTLMLVHDSK